MKSLVEIIEPAPILNIPEFHLAFSSTIPRDSLGHPKHFEFVALAGQIFTVEEIYPRHHHSIYRISSPRYKSRNLFLDSRFTRPASNETPGAPPEWSRAELASKMERLLGTRYVWGGNWSLGVSRMLHYYPPQKALDKATLALWTLRGVDCSGLLYEVANGTTPRNTSELVHFGEPLSIDTRELLPMDMVVWPGHVWFVLNKEHSIESKSPFGVILRPLPERLEETKKERGSAFAIRRFCSH